uniref:Putative metal-dependent peptidase n=1 Tax=viral metagenome TaxID=1070528 RepID=A0A6M3X4C1_9ZZZZ
MAASVLQRAKSQLVLQEPFYATILLNMDIIETRKSFDGSELWLAETDGTSLWINPDNFEELSVAEAKGVLKHEVMHVAQLHPWRGQGKEGRRWNHATDDVINPIIIDEGGELPDNVRKGVKGMSAEQRYNELPAEPPGSGNKPGPNNPLGNDVIPAKDKSQAGVDKAKQMISQAAAVAKAMGKLPEHVQAAIDEIFKPKVDWKEQLRQFLTEATPSDYSFSRPNRRYIAGEDPMYLPSMHGHDSMESLVFIMDTSGSITMDELKQGLGEVVGAVEDVCPKRLVVAYCDAAVQHHDVFDQPGEAEVATSFKRHGAGGTSMPAGLKWATRNFPNTKAAIVWTDGYTDFGDEDDYPFPVLWAITTPSITAPWGTTIHVALD